METIGDLYKTTGKEILSIMAGGSDDSIRFKKRNDLKQFTQEMGPSLHDKSICVRCQGYVQKLNRSAHWQKRFFQLAGNYLRYYRTSKCRIVRGAVDLMDLKSMDVDTRYNGVFIKLELVHRGLQREVQLKMLASQAEKWTPELQYFIDNKDKDESSWQARPGRMTETFIMKIKLKAAFLRLKHYQSDSADGTISTRSCIGNMSIDPDRKYEVILDDSGKSVFVDGRNLLHMDDGSSDETNGGDIDREQSDSEQDGSESEEGEEGEEGELTKYWGSDSSSNHSSDSSSHCSDEVDDTSSHCSFESDSSTMSSPYRKGSGVCVSDAGMLRAVSFEAFSTRVKVADFSLT
jgi:hypothetical protein